MNNKAFTLSELIVVLFISATVYLITSLYLVNNRQIYASDVTIKAALTYYNSLQKKARLTETSYYMTCFNNQIVFQSPTNNHFSDKEFILPKNHHFTRYQRLKIPGNGEIMPTTLAIQTPSGIRKITIQLGGQYVIKSKN